MNSDFLVTMVVIFVKSLYVFMSAVAEVDVWKLVSEAVDRGLDSHDVVSSLVNLPVELPSGCSSLGEPLEILLVHAGSVSQARSLLNW